VHTGFIRNRFFHSAQEFLKASHVAPAQVADAEANALAEYTEGWTWDYLRDPINTVYVRMLLAGQSRTGQMLSQMYARNGQMRLLTLRIGILHEGIP
jgi:hypothetical protein